MSWEALRLTSKSPSEVYGVLGPHGVEELLAKARDVCWREAPQETRSVASIKARLTEVFERNMKVWEAIRKPTPEAFFAELQPLAADGHVRQALVLTWMMMPRAGGREFTDSGKIVRHLFQRLMANWDEDDRVFTKGFDAAARKRSGVDTRGTPATKGQRPRGAKKGRKPTKPASKTRTRSKK